MHDTEQQIADLERLRDAQPHSSPVRASLEAAIAGLRAALPIQAAQTGGVNFGSAQVDEMGDAVGGDKLTGDKVLGDKIVNQFFDGQPAEDGEKLLRDYLMALLRNNQRLRLSRLTEARQSGAGQSLLPPLLLEDVFTTLTVDSSSPTTREHGYTAERARAVLERLFRRGVDAHTVTPERQRGALLFTAAEGEGIRASGRRDINSWDELTGLPPQTPLIVQVARPTLASEAVAQERRLVLLGAPGSGKSTVLRYLALRLAEHLLDPTGKALPHGWTTPVIPLLCPLGLVASAIARDAQDQNDVDILWQVLAAQLDGAGDIRGGLGRHVRPALRSGSVLLLLDGLDELPASVAPDGRSLRTRVSQAIQRLAFEMPQTTITVTCRVSPYEQSPATYQDNWRFRGDDGWTVQRIAPFAFGQVRRFVQGWYQAACAKDGAVYTPEAGQQRVSTLIEQLERSERLRDLTTSPLLLTMLTILHYNKESGDLPRDRALLYDECVNLLLDRWEPVRTPEVQAQGLLERLGIEKLATLDDIRAMMHTVALGAHERPPEPGDNRGVVRGAELEGELGRFLRRLRCDGIEDRLAAFQQALRDEAGLLQEAGDDVYSFPHLTFQEYLAACALADSRTLDETAYRLWSGRDGDRWREVLLLLAGRLRQQRKVELQGVRWLRTLLNERAPGGAAKSVSQRQRDALLAIDSYREWDGRAALTSFEPEEIDQLEQRVAKALALVLVSDPLATLVDRLRSGNELGRLGDPRPGVCDLRIDWCDVPKGPFLLGSSDAHEQAYDDEKPQRMVELAGFRISRYPVTNAQWRMFIEAGGYAERRWWSEAGWQTKEQRGWTQPEDWDESRFSNSNQPVVGVSWHEATAFCRWLSVQLGYKVCLPSEAEWEKAARGTDGRIYPWGNVWDTERANTSEGDVGTTTPIGCYPNGASPCGAFDMSGNVLEWTATPWTSNHQQSDGTTREAEDGERFVIRGGSWALIQRLARCAYRYDDHPSFRLNCLGLRVVAALTLM